VIGAAELAPSIISIPDVPPPLIQSSIFNPSNFG
jgi:hypothetical protein